MPTSPKLIRRLPIGITLVLTASFFVAMPSAPAAPAIPRTESADVALAPGSVRSISKTLTLPIRANMIGLTWSGAAADVQMRVRSLASGWGEWQELGSNDSLPDRNSPERSARRATEAMWVGTADRVMVKLQSSGPVSGVRLHAINTLGDARPVSLLSRVGRAIAGIFRASPRVANATPAVPSIRTRAQWGADERSRRCCPRYSETVEVAFVHHTVSANNYTAAQAPGLIRAIYRYHRYSLDYDDIAYNFLVDRFGVVYEGRYGGITLPVIGAHTEGMNSKTTGVALLGTFSSAYPSGPMMIALQKFLAWKLDVHHVPPFGVVPMTSGGSAKLRAGQVVNMPRIAGHRDAQATDCPGNRIYSQLPRVRSTITPWGAPKLYLNAAGRVLRIDGDGVNETAQMKVWLSGDLRWRIAFKDAGGNATKTFMGTGTVADVTWDGRDALTGQLARTGVGEIRIDAWNAQDVAATPAIIKLYVVNDHPVGTVLSTGAGRLLIAEGGVAQPIPTDAVYGSWFRSAEAVATTATEAGRYTTGLPITFRNGSVLRTPDGTYHFVSNGSRRSFASQSIFQALGYTDAAAVAATQAEVEALPAGAPIAEAAVHPEGAVVKDSNNVSWVIEQGSRRKVPSLVVRRSWYRDAEVVGATAGDLALPEGAPVAFRPGSLLKTEDGIHWLIVGATRKSFKDPWFFAAYGYRSSAPLSVTWREILILPYGGEIA